MNRAVERVIELVHPTMQWQEAVYAYHTTEQGGSHGCGLVRCGTVFRLTRQPNGHWKETILHNFKPGKGGHAPFAGVAIDSAGNLYGTTIRRNRLRLWSGVQAGTES